MEHLVGQHEVDKGVCVHPHVEVLPVVPREARPYAPVKVHHGGDAVKAISIKLVLVDVPAQVGQEEPEHLPLPVVEDLGVPQRVLPFARAVEVAVVRPVELVQPVKHVLGRVAVHHVQHHEEPHPVRAVHEILEVVWGTIATGGGKEASHVVPKAAVVGVLHDGHELHTGVAQVLDVREHVVREVAVRGDLGLVRGYAHVSFVDANVARSTRSVVAPLVRLRGRPVNFLVRHLLALYLDHVLGPRG